MLKNLLSKLKLRAQPKPEPSPKPEPENLSPNLLSSFDEEFQNIYKTTHDSIRFLKVFMVVLPAVFLVSLVYNQTLAFKISSLNKSINKLKDEITFYKPTMEEVASISARIDVYKTAKTQNLNVSGILEQIYGVTPPEVSMLSLKYDQNIVTLTINSESALNIALAINNYFKTGKVQEIVLKTANLDTHENRFIATLDLVLNK